MTYPKRVLIAIDQLFADDMNNTNKTITVTIASTDTDDLSFKNAVYELEMASSSSPPVVTPLLDGKVSLVREVAV